MSAPTEKGTGGKHRNIRRRKTGHGWEVTVTRASVPHRKIFSDCNYGGEQGSLKAAIAYRDDLIPKLGKQVVKRRSKRNTSGEIGVVRQTKVNPSGKTYDFWVAIWREDESVTRSRKFSVNKYGEDGAFELAVKARKQGIRKSTAKPTSSPKGTKRKRQI